MDAIQPNPDLESNRDRYRRFADLAGRTRSTAPDSVLAYIAAAAESAWLHHPGFFADWDLERLISEAPSVPLPPTSDIDRRAERVLHVLTRALEIGGHTRLATRWMELDSSRDHSIVLTLQDAGATPRSLRDAVRSRGGAIHHLDRRPGGLSTRANRLARLAADFDYVVLHTHPSDPIPVAAFRASGSPTVLLLNHADHVFWLGATAADLVVSIREAGVSLCRTRRAIPGPANALLPIPVPPAAKPAGSNAAAKQRLGIPDESVVVLTIASAHKFAGSATPGFAALHADILNRNPNLFHIIVGVPRGSESWDRTSEQTNGRLQTVPPTSDLADVWAAADIYADSFPLASLTSTLEAMSRGIPCVSFDPFDGSSPVLRLGDAERMALFYEGSDIGAYESALARLATTPHLREEAGAAALDTIRSRHWGDGWRRQLEATYAAARNCDRDGNDRPVDPDMVDTPTALDHNLATLQAAQTLTVSGTDLVSGPILSSFPRREAIQAFGIPSDRRGQARIAVPGWMMFAVGGAGRALDTIRPSRSRR